MSDHIRQTIESVLGTINSLQAELKTHKQTVNTLCKLIGEPPHFPDADELSVAGTTTRRDEFYGKPLATVVRTILERRQKSNKGAASVPEIFEAMKAGGYQFDTKNDENAKRGLHIALAKNTATFHKLPHGIYGLREWYPAIKEPRQAKVGAGGGDKPAPIGDTLTDELVEQETEVFEPEALARTKPR